MTARDFLTELTGSCFSAALICLHDAKTGSQAIFTAAELNFVFNHAPDYLNTSKIYLIRVSGDVIHIYII